jgi:hypothetical protein
MHNHHAPLKRAWLLLSACVCFHIAAAQVDVSPARLISAGGRHSCVVHNSMLECWGDEEFQNNGQREGRFVAVDCGSWHTCALDASGRASCFGAGYALQAKVPTTTFSTISAGAVDQDFVNSLPLQVMSEVKI